MQLTSPQSNQRASNDIAMSPANLAFAFSTIAVWLIGTLVTSILPQVVSSALSGILALACLQILVGGIGYLTRLELEAPNNPSFTKRLQYVFDFLKTSWPSILASPWLMGVALMAVTGVVLSLTMAITRIPGIGGFIGSLLIVPMFCFVLAALGIGLNIYLLPCVIGIERCGAIAGIRRLLQSLQKNPMQLMSGYLKILLGILPTALGSSLLMFFGLTFALVICKGGEALDALSMLSGSSGMGMWGAPTLGWGWLDNLSIGFIVLTWLAYLVISITVSFALLYYNTRVE